MGSPASGATHVSDGVKVGRYAVRTSSVVGATAGSAERESLPSVSVTVPALVTV